MTNETQIRKPLEILLVEPSQKHILRANQQWARVREKGIPLVVHTIGDRQSLDENLDKRSYDGIITAVSYPKITGEPEMEDGIYTVRIAKEKAIPIVLCADTPWFRTKGVAEFCHKSNVPVADALYTTNTEPKHWGYAYQALLWEMALKLQGGIENIGKALQLKQKSREEVFGKIHHFLNLYGIKDKEARHADVNEENKWRMCAFPREYG